uniref:Centrosomal protein 112 n=1 Tax=Acanthochromis polyacanthus TaxID=80966 RepID=A0A3Q1FMS0_9TELE
FESPQVTMSKYEDSWERLDTEFDHFLLDMKPYVLKHPNKSERQRCAMWIKKLCDPATCGSGLIGRKNRNMYARLLLHMLKRGVLEGPFTNKPEPGGLKTLPTYMVMRLQPQLWAFDVLPTLFMANSGRRLDSGGGEALLGEEEGKDRSKVFFCLLFQIENPRYLREKPIPLSPVSCQSILCGLFIYCYVDESILDRKNGEIEEVKSLYRAKQKESDEMIRKLEKKVQSVLRESQVICQSKEKQIAELRKLSDQSADSLKNEWEKKVRGQVEGLEDCAALSQRKTEQTVRELELRVKQQSVDVEKGNTLRQKVTQEKAQLEIHVASLSAELQEANRRIVILQKEKEQQSEQHQQTMQKLQAKHETDMSHLHQEHDLSAAKASELIEDLEKAVSQVRQQLQDSERRRQQQVRDQEIKFQQQKDEVLTDCEKKVSALHGEAERERTEAKRKIARLEDALREMEGQLDRARESQRQQIHQADMALEQFKKQVELSSEKAYADMKVQMEKVEEDLIRSRSLRENQAKEFSQQLDALRQKYEQQMAEQRMQHEQERTRLQQQHSAEKDSLVQERQREVSSLERQARAALHQHQQHTQEWRKRDAQTISDLEVQLSALREKLQQVLIQHRQQLAEMQLVQEEKEQRAILDKEASLDRLRSDMERIRSDLERSHQQEKDAAQEKTNSRLKQIEKEFGQKLAKSAQLIAELQTSVCDSKEETVRLQQAMEKQLKEANARWDQERRTITQHADQANKALQEKVESLQRQLHCSEKKLLSKELETEEKVTLVHQEYEEKIKGLMPAELRQELEDTITSLKAQVRTDWLPNTDQMQKTKLEQACKTYSVC